MRKLIAMTTAGLIFAALPAYAGDDDDDGRICGRNTGDQAMSVQEITAKMTVMGYQVRQVEREQGCYEVYAIDKNGARAKLRLNAVTGEFLKFRGDRS